MVQSRLSVAVWSVIRPSEHVRDWFGQALLQWSQHERGESQHHTQQLQRELTLLRQQQDRLLNLRLLDEIDRDTFAAKNTELRDRIAEIALRIESADRSRSEQAELAERVFELSQALEEKWLTADFAAKRQLLDIVFLNFTLDGVSLCYELRKPFDMLVEGLTVPSDRGDKI